jgi:hypothetical protein
VAGVTAVLRESGRMSGHPCAHVHLFIFPPTLVGVELGHMCGMAAVSSVCLCLRWSPAADLKLVRTKEHGKLGVGVT